MTDASTATAPAPRQFQVTITVTEAPDGYHLHMPQPFPSERRGRSPFAGRAHSRLAATRIAEIWVGQVFHKWSAEEAKPR